MADGVIELSSSSDDVVCLDDESDPDEDDDSPPTLPPSSAAGGIIVPWTPLQRPRAERLATRLEALEGAKGPSTPTLTPKLTVPVCRTSGDSTPAR